MRRLLIIADRPGWCFARRAAALQEYAPTGWNVTVDYIAGRNMTDIVYEQHDLVFLLTPLKAREVRNIFKILNVKVPLVIAHNSGVGRLDHSLSDVLQAADYTIVNNHAAWALAAFGARDYRACNISNGVDLRVFRSEIPTLQRPFKLLWIASDNKAEDEFDVKGYKSVLQPLANVCKNFGIETDFRVVDPDSVMDDDSMREWYNGGQVVVCASSSEGTPNICLEGAACGCALLTTPVGNMPELIRHDRNGLLIRRRHFIDFWEAVKGLPLRIERYNSEMQKVLPLWDWSQRAPWFYALFSAIIEQGAANVEPFTYLTKSPEAVANGK